jgi:hypothetical protein
LGVQNTFRQKCLDFGKCHAIDVAGEELCTEILDYKMLLDANRDTLPLSPLDLLSFIVSYGDDVLSKFAYCLANSPINFCVNSKL